MQIRGADLNEMNEQSVPIDSSNFIVQIFLLTRTNSEQNKIIREIYAQKSEHASNRCCVRNIFSQLNCEMIYIFE